MGGGRERALTRALRRAHRLILIGLAILLPIAFVAGVVLR